MKKILSVLLSLAVLFSPLVPAKSASAASFDLGNDNSPRTIVDTYSNFTIIDTNNPASMNGQITSFDYYASNTNPFRFVVVDSLNTVKWVSDEIIPASMGAHSFVLDTPVMVMTGYNIGMYFASTGTIPFEYGGDPAIYTPNNNGMPTIGAVMSVEGTSGRTYSLVAHGNDTNCAVMEFVSDTTTTVMGNDNAIPVAVIHPAWTASIPGATWIWKSSATLVDETVSFEKIVNIPGSVMSATLNIAADNSYKVFVVATEIISEPNWENFHLAGQDTYNVTSSFNSGLQTMKIDVTNYGAFDVSSNPAGLMYKLTVNYCSVPVSINCPAAPSIAAHYLKDVLKMKPASTTYKNVISMVAKKMGPQKNFDGTGACTKPEYDEKVKDFVNSKVN